MALFRENAAYEAKQGFTFDESDYLSMIPLILKKEPTARVFERLTDAEILRIVEALVGFADSAGYGESRTQLRTCSSCRAQEPHRRLLDVRAMPPRDLSRQALPEAGLEDPQEGLQERQVLDNRKRGSKLNNGAHGDQNFFSSACTSIKACSDNRSAFSSV